MSGVQVEEWRGQAEEEGMRRAVLRGADCSDSPHKMLLCDWCEHWSCRWQAV